MSLGRCPHPRGPPFHAPNTMKQLLERIDFQNPRHLARLAVAFIVLHTVAWLLMAAISQRAPHWDNIEELVWIQSPEWGYSKHPPFSTWWIWLWAQVFGRNFWASYFAGQINVALMLWIVWRIALLILSPARALAALVFTAVIFYHSINGVVADQNTIQLMPVALLLWTLLLGVREGRWWQWAIAGIAAAACLLTKYSAVIWFAVMGVWVLLDPRMRTARAWAGIALGIAICLILLVPHAMWMVRENYPTWHYMNYQVGNETHHFNRLLRFVLSQASRIVPLLVTLLMVRWALRRESTLPGTLGDPQPSEWRFVTMMAIGPTLLACALGTGLISLHANWATTFFVMLGVWAVRWAPRVDGAKLARSVLAVGIVVDLLMVAGVSLSNGLLVDLIKRTSRSNFPAIELGAEMDKIWDSRFASPLKVVIGETWIAGVTSVKSHHQPYVLQYGIASESPWVSEKMIDDCGALIVVDRRETEKPPNDRVDAYLARATQRGTIDIPWNRLKATPALTVEWALIEPRNPGACAR